MHNQRYTWPKLSTGVCYYPEHWNESMWEDDLRRMLDCGITTVRVGEFAWAILEPAEGEFHFDYFDRFLDLCAGLGMGVIFGTPTATPPAWLTETYPEVLNARIDGVPYRHGLRRHYNYNAPIYQRKCAAIVTQLAQHYGRHPAIVGWQIDNELNCETNDFFSQADDAAFRAFLQRRYGTLDALNDAWGAVFWSQTYTDWAQVHLPRVTVNGSQNPHMQLDYSRFVSDSAIRFCALQAEILRQYIAPGVFITTNGMFGRLDNHRMTDEALDVYTYDSYPNFAFALDTAGTTDFLRDRWSSLKLTEVRSICPHFGIMEQQSGPGSWSSRMEAPSPRPGQLRLWALQSVAHGADYVSFFRWRTCTFGTEIYWHGLLNYDNRDNRRIEELRRFTADLEKLQPIAGADFVAPVAIVRDYDNVWDSELDVWHRRVCKQSEDALFEACERAHVPCDLLYLTERTEAADLARYRALFMPHAVIMAEAHAGLLEAYVRHGGTLIVGCRSGYKDARGHCVTLPQPGLLQPLTGTDVQDFSFASPVEEPPFALWDGKRLDTPVFNDVLTPLPGTRVLAGYASSYFAGSAALTERALGEGRTLHLGSAFSVSGARMILDYLGLSEPYADAIELPATVELAVREKAGRRWLFALNYQPTAQTVTLRKPMTSLLSDREDLGPVELPPFGVEVWALPE